MTAPDTLPDHLRTLYGPGVSELRAALPDLGDCIATQMVELSRDPSRDRCDRVLHNLAGVVQHVRRLAAAQEVAR